VPFGADDLSEAQVCELFDLATAGAAFGGEARALTRDVESTCAVVVDLPDSNAVNLVLTYFGPVEGEDATYEDDAARDDPVERVTGVGDDALYLVGHEVLLFVVDGVELQVAVAGEAASPVPALEALTAIAQRLIDTVR
jgi:hypothetical protein